MGVNPEVMAALVLSRCSCEPGIFYLPVRVSSCINGTDFDAFLPSLLGSVVEVNVGADMAAGASHIGIRICTITEYEDDGAMVSRNQDGQVMNISLEDSKWKQVWKCGERDEFGGGGGGSGEHCGVLRPDGIIAYCFSFMIMGHASVICNSNA
jgi:hypothetical protein